MWDALLTRLRGKPEPTALPEPDEKLALGALLVRVAKSDNHYDVDEIGEIDRILAHGAEQARIVADPILRKAYDIVGMVGRD